MNLAEMKIYAKSLVRDGQMIDAHFVRWLNMAYRQLASDIIVPRLHSGTPVELTPVDDTTNNYYAPYDYQRTISFTDENARSLDPILSQDVRQWGEYNTFGTFVQFYEPAGINITPLYDSFGASVTCTIANRALTVTASSAVFVSTTHEGQWLLPINRNSTAGASNPEDYGYLIDDITGTTAQTTCTLARPFRGNLSDGGTVGGITTGYFEICPRNTPIIRIWGDPQNDGTDDIEILMEYQRIPSKLANDEDIPEEPRLCSAMVHKAIQLAGWAYQNAFAVKQGDQAIAQAVGEFKSSKEFDRELVHNFLTTNPQGRSYSMVSGRHMGARSRGSSGIRY